MIMSDEIEEKGRVVLEQLKTVLDRTESFRDVAGDRAYPSFLHGQAAGIVLALKVLFPGPGALGDKAEDLARSVLGEKGCTCRNNASE
jgi:hypothetical protein